MHRCSYTAIHPGYSQVAQTLIFPVLSARLGVAGCLLTGSCLGAAASPCREGRTCRFSRKKSAGHTIWMWMEILSIRASKPKALGSPNHTACNICSIHCNIPTSRTEVTAPLSHEVKSGEILALKTKQRRGTPFFHHDPEGPLSTPGCHEVGRPAF